MALKQNCVICGLGGMTKSTTSFSDLYDVTCMNCGRHLFTGTAFAVAERLFEDPGSAMLRARTAYGLRRVSSDTWVLPELLRDLGTVSLPPALERIDNLVHFMANAREPGETVGLSSDKLTAELGATSGAGVTWVVHQAMHKGLIRNIHQSYIDDRGKLDGPFQLTAEGWQRYEVLTRTGAASKHAFMAMKFNDDEMRWIYAEHMRPAVADTDFELRAANDDQQTAGSIDNRMRVEIRTSRFIVCDITHGNRGAYWEAGFAEGIGRPVFYTCRTDVLQNKSHPDHPHFDTAHQLIIGWDPHAPVKAMAELKAAIRATLPQFARMEDPAR